MDEVSSLHKAIAAGNLDDVQKCVKSGANVNHVYGMQGTALCNAIYSKQEKIIQYLIESGCDVNISDYGGEPPLLLALRKRLFEAAKHIIESVKCNVNICDPGTKKTPLCYAAENGMNDIVKLLISKHSCKTDTVDGDGNSALHLAITGNDRAIIKTLSRVHELKTVHNNAGLLPVHMISKTGDVEVLKLLYEDNKKCGVSLAGRVSKDLNSGTSFNNDTPLILAAQSRHLEMVKYLIEQGVDVNAVNNRHQTALLVASGLNNLDITSLLLKAGADPDIGGSLTTCNAANPVGVVLHNQRLTPLAAAAIFDHVKVAEMLLKNGASITMCDNRGQSPLFKALHHNSVKAAWLLLNEITDTHLDVPSFGSPAESLLHAVVMCTEDAYKLTKFLIQHGCSTNITDRLSYFPLQAAISYENTAVVEAILDCGGDVHITDSAGCTPLHMAAMVGNVKIAKLLLCHGADIDSKADEGTVFYTALDSYMENFALFLIEAGCSLNKEWYLFDSSVSQGENLQFPDVLADYDEFYSWLKNKASSVPRLEQLCIKTLRKMFCCKTKRFSDIALLPLPAKLLDVLSYK